MTTDFLTSVRELCGEQAVVALINARGGTNVYIPSRSNLGTAGQWLIDDVGYSHARTICFHCGGRRCYIPRNHLYMARRAVASGSTAVELKKEFSVSLRTAQRWISRWRANTGPQTPHGGARPPGQS